jgi:hypothetical protein
MNESSFDDQKVGSRTTSGFVLAHEGEFAHHLDGLGRGESLFSHERVPRRERDRMTDGCPDTCRPSTALDVPG